MEKSMFPITVANRNSKPFPGNALYDIYLTKFEEM